MVNSLDWCFVAEISIRLKDIETLIIVAAEAILYCNVNNLRAHHSVVKELF